MHLAILPGAEYEIKQAAFLARFLPRKTAVGRSGKAPEEA
jgi:hypothetical protein